MVRSSLAHLFACALLLSALASSSPAQIPKPAEPELKQTYALQVVLHIADNPGLTDVFYDRVERELRDSLQADFGDLVRVDVTRKHPHLNDVLDKGLANTLKTWTERNGVKTHFVLLDFNGVDYEIQTCQYDGVTGQPNPSVAVENGRMPIVRQEKTRDREFVAKAAALMVERDFGLIATFPTWPQGKTKPQSVPLEFKGGALVALDRWVKKGDVFGVVQVPLGNGASQMIPDALVLIQEPPQDGVCTAQLFWRYTLPAGGNVSYRCVKLGTSAGPLRLRIVKAGPNNSVAPKEWALQIRRQGFTGEKETLLQAHTLSAGLFDSANPPLKPDTAGVFDRVAFVSVVDGAIRAEVLVPLLSDQPYLIKLSNQPETNTLNDQPKILAWKDSVNLTFRAVEQKITDLNNQATAKDGTRAQILDIAQQGLDRARAYPQLIAEREKLFNNPTPAEQRDLKEWDDRLKSINGRKNELTDFIAKQKEIEAKENSPQMKEWKAKVEQAGLLVKELEIGKAIDLYEKIRMEGYQDPGLDDHLKNLYKLWEIGDEKYRDARAFIYEVFPKLDTTGLQARLPDAVKALEECKRVRDTLAARKLMLAIGQHVPRLETEGKALNPQLNPEDDIPAKRLQEVAAGIKKLSDDLNSYLDKQKPPGEK